MSPAFRRSSARPTRLAPTIQPSSDRATMPSATLPMPSGWVCRCRRILRLQVASMSRLSIMRAAVLARPSVWPWPWRWSPEMSSTPMSSPVAERIGEAAQVRKPLRSRKCSEPWISIGLHSASAVPMALVPRCASCQEAPEASATRSALPTKLASPSVCMSMPCGSASTTTLWLWRTCSNTYSMTGREWASSTWLLASAWRRLPLPAGSVAARPVGARPAAMLRCQERTRRSSSTPTGHWPVSSNCWRACRKASMGEVCRTLSPARGRVRPALGKYGGRPCARQWRPSARAPNCSIL